MLFYMQDSHYQSLRRLEVDMDGKVDLWEVMAYILGRKTLSRTRALMLRTPRKQPVGGLDGDS